MDEGASSFPWAPELFAASLNRPGVEFVGFIAGAGDEVARLFVSPTEGNYVVDITKWPDIGTRNANLRRRIVLSHYIPNINRSSVIMDFDYNGHLMVRIREGGYVRWIIAEGRAKSFPEDDRDKIIKLHPFLARTIRVRNSKLYFLSYLERAGEEIPLPPGEVWRDVAINARGFIWLVSDRFIFMIDETGAVLRRTNARFPNGKLAINQHDQLILYSDSEACLLSPSGLYLASSNPGFDKMLAVTTDAGGLILAVRYTHSIEGYFIRAKPSARSEDLSGFINTWNPAALGSYTLGQLNEIAFSLGLGRHVFQVPILVPYDNKEEALAEIYDYLSYG